jgi:hypothetical protein
VSDGGGSIQPSRRGKGHRPLQGPMYLLAVPVPLRAVMNVMDDIACLHSLFRLGFWDGGVAYRFHVSFVPPPVSIGIPIQRGLTYIELRVSSKAFGLGL